MLKQETGCDEIFEDTWGWKKNDWLPYLKNDSLSAAFSFDKCEKHGRIYSIWNEKQLKCTKFKNLFLIGV